MKILISGFEPFLEIKENPSQILATELKVDYERVLQNQQIENSDFVNVSLVQKVFAEIKLETVILPVEYDRAFMVLKEAIDKFQPDVVLSTGVAAGRSEVGLERIAINHRSVRLKDNTGQKASSSKIHDSGPDGVFSNLDVDAIVAETNEIQSKDNFVFKVSNTAGTYVCNALMYYLFLDAKMNSYQAGFLHIPNQTDSDSIRKYKELVLNLISVLKK